MYTKAILTTTFSLMCLISQTSLNGMDTPPRKNNQLMDAQENENLTDIITPFINSVKEINTSKNHHEKDFALKKYGVNHRKLASLIENYAQSNESNKLNYIDEQLNSSLKTVANEKQHKCIIRMLKSSKNEGYLGKTYIPTKYINQHMIQASGQQ